MFVLRINTLAKGRSGISEENMRKMVRAFNKGLLPLIPEQGTVGASGDLAPLSHLAMSLLGEGEAWDPSLRAFRPASERLAALGLSPIKLRAKEGLALINGTQFITALLAEGVVKAEAVMARTLELIAFNF